MRFHRQSVVVLVPALGVIGVACVIGAPIDSSEGDTHAQSGDDGDDDDDDGDTGGGASTHGETTGSGGSATAAESSGTMAAADETSASTAADGSDDTAGAPLDVIDRIDCGEDGELFPLCGGSSNFAMEEWHPDEVDLEFMPGEGPDGRWAVEFHHQPTTTGVGEIYFGWSRANTNGCDIGEQGESCVVRWWFRTVSPQQTGQFGAKLFILGDNDGADEDRIIGTWREWCEGSCYTFDVDKNIHGVGPNFIDPTPDSWHSVQVVIQSSSTPETPDGSMAIWLDNDDEAAPTDVRTGLALPATWNGGWGFGMFRNSDEDGDHVRYRIYCVELARTFDANFTERTRRACAD